MSELKSDSPVPTEKDTIETDNDSITKVDTHEPLVPPRPPKTRPPKKEASADIPSPIEPDQSDKPIPSIPERPKSTSVRVATPEPGTIPIIPKRPESKTGASSSPIPVIPARPEGKSSVSSSPVPTIPSSRPVKQVVMAPEKKEEVNENDGSTTPNKIPEHHDVTDHLHSTLNTSDAIDFDGDTTPGNSNTKITFKDEVDDEAQLRSDTSSFDDDVETVKDKDVDNTEVVGETDEEDTREQEVFQQDEEPVEKPEVDSEDETEPIQEEQKEEPAVEEPKEAIEVDKKEEVTQVEKAEGQDKSKEVVEEQVKEESKTVEETEKHVEEVKEDIDPKQSEITATVKEPIAEVKETQEQKPVTPTIPSRPPKKSPELAKVALNEPKPSIPPRPSKNIESPKPQKAPPPKPKKLSSRIAAFQQQLFEQSSNDASNAPPPIARKLTSEKTGFMSGVGIPLPGMFNPLQLKKQQEAANEQEEEEEEDSSAVERKVEPVASARRAKGPRGKRLPKALSEPVNIETESRFKLETGELFSLSFTKKEEPKEEVNEEDKDRLEEEKDVVADEDIAVEESSKGNDNDINDVAGKPDLVDEEIDKEDSTSFSEIEKENEIEPVIEKEEKESDSTEYSKENNQVVDHDNVEIDEEPELHDTAEDSKTSDKEQEQESSVEEEEVISKRVYSEGEVVNAESGKVGESSKEIDEEDELKFN
ncbi:uncharacterized protein SPAPADRAFT_50859 [Spathaspora passalidarum NRRL Y-27907]|uniref:Uncharacterized protein n=1 Tax=Spathaspora passalidarum (strain NRRL Y-27907 / 11-Y1) TaxID=619300 RepID=G3APX2_SPAPN|nr:uncharacterized protein SPAPADRAFT_50859 [Spathaspora passalidarum NRRL Y-27907]EGW32293.1 hypothetical protein SPAPADRAFT_50859 [Spathaspora passalidarum NRRL Y-27907]